MNSRNRNFVFNIGALLIGASSIFIIHLFGDEAYYYLLILFIVVALIISLKQQLVPWQLIIIMLMSNYTIGLIYMPGWGQLLPVELMLILLYWGSIGLICKLAINLGKKYNERKA